MTKTLTLRSFDIPAIHKFGIGFDNMFDELMRVSAQQGNTNYPPYNIVQITKASAIEISAGNSNLQIMWKLAMLISNLVF